MRTARVSLTTLRRLDKVKASLLDENGEARQRVMLVPPIPTGPSRFDDWERIAVASQEALLVFCASDAGLPNTASPQPEASDIKLYLGRCVTTGERHLMYDTPNGPMRWFT